MGASSVSGAQSRSGAEPFAQSPAQIAQDACASWASRLRGPKTALGARDFVLPRARRRLRDDVAQFEQFSR
ncbi:MAG TPA: hypothetical protein VGK73_31825 [Polyangiaceae bacterium]